MTAYIEDNIKNTINSQIEGETLNQLLVLEGEFQVHNTLIKTEIHLQKELLSRLWTLSQRYMFLQSTEASSLCPKIYAGSADVLLQEFTDKLKQIRRSNCRVNNSLTDLRKSCLAFENLCGQLDMTAKSPLIVGDAFHKPIAYFIELFSDLFKYFHAWLLKLKFLSNQLDPQKADTIENYKKEVETCEDFEEYLSMGLTYCKCLKSKTK